MSSTTRQPPSPGTAACPDDAPDPNDAPAPDDAPAPSVLALIARRARDPTLGRACAVRWLPSLRGTPPEEWSYRRLWIAAARRRETPRRRPGPSGGARERRRADEPTRRRTRDHRRRTRRSRRLGSRRFSRTRRARGSSVRSSRRRARVAGATLAVALAGAAYAPLVAADPVDRLAAAAASAGVVALITDVRADPTHARRPSASGGDRAPRAEERRKEAGGKGAGGKGERFGAFVVVDASDLFPDAEEADEGAEAFASASASFASASASFASASASFPSSASLSDSAIASIDRPAALASVFFTSGSTGRRGVPGPPRRVGGALRREGSDARH